ncbi:MAG TPA: tricarballylate dehydrogenase, partial [Dehalococcoidia bacterium]|nr:tricarballylate dehydrogenase [Dehalococcoidia bacterium]
MSLEVDKRGSIKSILIKNEQTYRAVKCSAIVLASGGFEANEEMRARYLGPGWELAKVRGTRYNTGDGINMALQIGAQSYGHWSGC